MTAAAFVEMVRGGLVESSHAVHAAVVDVRGGLVASAGDPDRPTHFRSAAKPIQALPLVEDGVVDDLGLTDEELAVCCASHGAEPAHLEAVRSILRRAGVGEEALRCGAERPLRPASGTGCASMSPEGGPLPIHHNCSGKHAGMLALASAMGWQTEAYHRPAHPVQRRMHREVARWTGLDPQDLVTAVDGCGVQCFGGPLRALATAMARLGDAARKGEAAARVIHAMIDHPFMVGGSGRTCTDVMARAGGLTFVKVGAEGVFVGGLPEEGVGFALKVADGAWRAANVAVVALLAELGALDERMLAALADHARPRVPNSRGEEVGFLRMRGPCLTAKLGAPARRA